MLCMLAFLGPRIDAQYRDLNDYSSVLGSIYGRSCHTEP